MYGEATMGQRAIRIVILLATIFFSVLMASPIPADDSLATLLEECKRCGLLLPSKDARLVVLTESSGTVNGVPQYSHTLALVAPEKDGQLMTWVGCRSSTLSGEVKAVRAVYLFVVDDSGSWKPAHVVHNDVVANLLVGFLTETSQIR